MVPAVQGALPDKPIAAEQGEAQKLQRKQTSEEPKKTSCGEPALHRMCIWIACNGTLVTRGPRAHRNLNWLATAHASVMTTKGSSSEAGSDINCSNSDLQPFGHRPKQASPELFLQERTHAPKDASSVHEQRAYAFAFIQLSLALQPDPQSKQ